MFRMVHGGIIYFQVISNKSQLTEVQEQMESEWLDLCQLPQSCAQQILAVWTCCCDLIRVMSDRALDHGGSFELGETDIAAAAQFALLSLETRERLRILSR